MTDEIAMAGGAGAAAWFADKVFGPSADALGQNLRAYLAERLPRIFGKAEEIAKARGVDPQPIKPGLLARMIADASFSDDADEITDWWANLFIDASVASSNEHAVFADMMAFLGPAEVRCLAQMMEDNPRMLAFMSGKNASIQFGADEELERLLTQIVSIVPPPSPLASTAAGNLDNPATSWPIKVTSFSLPWLQNGIVVGSGGNTIFHERHKGAIEVLKRAGVLADLNVTVPYEGYQPRLRGVSVTLLGFDFYCACTGKPRSGYRPTD